MGDVAKRRSQLQRPPIAFRFQKQHPISKVAADLRAAPARPKSYPVDTHLDRSKPPNIDGQYQTHATIQFNRTSSHKVGLHRSEIDGYKSYPVDTHLDRTKPQTLTTCIKRTLRSKSSEPVATKSGKSSSRSPSGARPSEKLPSRYPFGS